MMTPEAYKLGYENARAALEEMETECRRLRNALREWYCWGVGYGGFLGGNWYGKGLADFRSVMTQTYAALASRTGEEEGKK